MKVAITQEAKSIITLDEAPIANWLVKEMKSTDEWSATEYAEMAARMIGATNLVKVLEAKASVCKNSRVYDRFFEGSKNFDVWIEFTAVLDNSFSGIIIAGACLSDIWDISGDEVSNGELRKHMFIRRFQEV